MSKAKVRKEILAQIKSQEEAEKKLQEEKARNEETKKFYERCLQVLEKLLDNFKEAHKSVDIKEFKSLVSAITQDIAKDEKAVLEGRINKPTKIMEKLHDGEYKTLEEFYKDNWEAPIETVLPSLKKPEPEFRKAKRVPKTVVSAKPKSKKPEKPEPKPEAKPVSDPETKPESKPELEPKQPEPVKKTASSEKKVEVVSTTGEKFQAFIYPLSVYSDEEPMWVCYGFDGGKGVFLDKEAADVGRAMSKKVVTLQVVEFEKPLVLGEARKTYWKVVGVYNPSDYEDKPIGKSPELTTTSVVETSGNQSVKPKKKGGKKSSK